MGLSRSSSRAFGRQGRKPSCYANQFPSKANLSNSDQLIFANKPIMKVETSSPSLSFRSTELSQPI